MRFREIISTLLVTEFRALSNAAVVNGKQGPCKHSLLGGEESEANEDYLPSQPFLQEGGSSRLLKAKTKSLGDLLIFSKENREMKVVSIRSKMIFKFYDPRAQERVPEGIRFLAGSALTLWLPTLMYSYVVGQPLPFYLMVLNEALGVLLGVLLYSKPSDGILSCVPVSHIPNIPRDGEMRRMKSVA